MGANSTICLLTLILHHHSLGYDGTKEKQEAARGWCQRIEESMTFTSVRVRGTYDDEWAWWWELACVWGSSQVWKGCTLGTAHRRQGLMSFARPPRPLHTGQSRLRDT